MTATNENINAFLTLVYHAKLFSMLSVNMTDIKPYLDLSCGYIRVTCKLVVPSFQLEILNANVTLSQTFIQGSHCIQSSLGEKWFLNALKD